VIKTVLPESFISDSILLFYVSELSQAWRLEIKASNLNRIERTQNLSINACLRHLAAFGEELVYGGYLMNRLAGLFRGTGAAWAMSLVVIAMVFGCSHTGRGATGMLENIWNGLLLGGLYLACGRNLTAAIVAHGVTDTLDLLLMYLGKYPGIS